MDGNQLVGGLAVLGIISAIVVGVAISREDVSPERATCVFNKEASSAQIVNTYSGKVIVEAPDLASDLKGNFHSKSVKFHVYPARKRCAVEEGSKVYHYQMAP